MANRSNTRSRQIFRGSRNGSSFRGARGRGRGGASAARSVATPKQDDEGTRLAERFEQVQTYDDIDEKLGFARIQEGPKKEGWLVNMHPVECAFLTEYPRRRVGLRVLWAHEVVFDMKQGPLPIQYFCCNIAY
jgi:hypothetical protein